MTWSRPDRRRGEDGAAVVLALGLSALLLLVAGVSAGVTGIVVAHRRAQAAADLAALAAAQEVQAGGDGCAAGRAIAIAHRANLAECRVDGAEVEVEVTVSLPPVLGGSALPARARAGPDVLSA